MILVDPRVGTSRNQTRSERLEEYISTLKSRVTCRVKEAKPQLNSGDFCFEGNGPTGVLNIGVEIKELRDFLGSMQSERLAGDQIVKMSDDYAMSFIIVQGIWKPGPTGALLKRVGKEWKPVSLAAKGPNSNTMFSYSRMFGHIISLSVQKNIIVFHSSTQDETLWQVALLYGWWQKQWDEHQSTDPIKLQTEVVYARISWLRKFAAELPGIGWTRSRAVEKAFISVHQMVNASVEQWESIEGIGPKTARNVVKALREVVV